MRKEERERKERKRNRKFSAGLSVFCLFTNRKKSWKRKKENRKEVKVGREEKTEAELKKLKAPFIIEAFQVDVSRKVKNLPSHFFLPFNRWLWRQTLIHSRVDETKLQVLKSVSKLFVTYDKRAMFESRKTLVCFEICSELWMKKPEMFAEDFWTI